MFSNLISTVKNWGEKTDLFILKYSSITYIFCGAGNKTVNRIHAPIVLTF